MANKQDIEETYDYMDVIFRSTMGENGDITCALYNGDFSKSLEQAQKDKHVYILDAIRFKPGSRVLDIGCGWGPMLKAVTERGGHAVGLTLSTKQAEACTRSGFEVYLQDWNEITGTTFGTFDGIISVGAFEHFCSKEEYLAGKQDAIYEQFLVVRGCIAFTQYVVVGCSDDLSRLEGDRHIRGEPDHRKHLPGSNHRPQS